MPDVAIADEAEAADVGEAAAAEGPPFRIKALLVSGKEAAPRRSGTFRTPGRAVLRLTAVFFFNLDIEGPIF